MKLRSFLISSIVFLLFCQAADAQKVLLLQKPGKTNWFMYNIGDQISVRMGEPEFVVSGKITMIDDSSCMLNYNNPFQLSKVKEVTRTRHFLNGAWRTFYAATVVYFGGSILNRSINNESPVIDNTVPIVCGSLAVLGTTAFLFRNHHCKIKDGWKLKVLDFDIYKKNYEPKE